VRDPLLEAKGLIVRAHLRGRRIDPVRGTDGPKAGDRGGGIGIATRRRRVTVPSFSEIRARERPVAHGPSLRAGTVVSVIAGRVHDGDGERIDGGRIDPDLEAECQRTGHENIRGRVLL
jgi:hypothetical protein